MKVLVTGATSLLGRAVVTRLQERGDEVAVFQRRPSGLGGAEHLGDVVDRAAVATAMAGVEAVVHLAARTMAVAIGPWAQFEETNVRGTQCVIDMAREAGVTRFVHVSSPSVASGGQSLVGAPAAAADPDRARGHYAKSKAQAELIALAANSPDLAVVAIRPHLIWGPGDTQLVGRIVSRARAGRLVIVGSGASLIDTIYVDNAADALVAGLDRAPLVGGRALVVTNGQPRPVRELINRIVIAAGLEPPRFKVPYRLARTGGLAAEQIWELLGREDDPPMTGFVAEQLSTAHWFDQRETREALGWEPAVTLAEGFRRLQEWFAAGRQGSGRS
ncbi:MAG: NAD-dependent epimerase/dehydratase family protein [Acidimicrobiia bacterium]|nr:NAD-dependent epimerase/dehydratase family protein [Acidimicrobiia bacterium]